MGSYRLFEHAEANALDEDFENWGNGNFREIAIGYEKIDGSEWIEIDFRPTLPNEWRVSINKFDKLVKYPPSLISENQYSER